MSTSAEEKKMTADSCAEPQPEWKARKLSEAHDPEKAQKLAEAIGRYKTVPGTLIAVLQEAQRIYGWISLETMQTIADGMEVPLAQVASVESFYSFFNNEPYGETIIRVCTSAPCHVSGADQTLEALKAELGIDVGETTPDGKFTLLGCDCLGVCDRSPAILVGEQLYGPVKPEDVPAFVQGLKDSEGGEDA